MSEQNTIVPHKPLVKASSELSAFLGMEPAMMIDTIKAQCFKGKRPEEVSDAQLATYISVANALKLNPLLPGMMYPFPDRNGAVTVMLGPDGVYTLLANNSEIVATKDGGPAWWTEHGKDSAGKETCTAYVNHRTKGLLKKTIWIDEWVVSSNPNWNSRRHHMAETRALKQVTRMVIHGVPFDDDERRIAEEVNVTHTADSGTPDKPGDPTTPVNATEQLSKRPARPPRAPKGAAAVVETARLAKDDAIDVGASPVQEPIAEPVKTAPASDDAPPVTTLADKERREFSGCSVNEFVVENFGKVGWGVKAQITGAFAGTVYDIAGTSLKDPADPSKGCNINPAWQLDKPVNISLFGKVRSNNTVAIMVEAISLAGDSEKSDEVP